MSVHAYYWCVLLVDCSNIIKHDAKAQNSESWVTRNFLSFQAVLALCAIWCVTYLLACKNESICCVVLVSRCLDLVMNVSGVSFGSYW